MKGRTSRLYLLAGALAVACYMVVPPLAGAAWLFEAAGLSVVVAIAVGVRRYRPGNRLPWAVFVVAQLVFVTGDFLYYTSGARFPSVADGFYLAYYPLQVWGLLLLIRSRARGHDAGSVLDALVIAVGFGLPVWLYLVSPYASQSDPGSLVSMAYPAMDVLLLAVAARLMIGNGARPRAFYLMVASIFCLILTDVAYGVIELSGSYAVGSWLDAGWMISYLLWGAAALDPSMRELSDVRAAEDSPLTGRRVLLVSSAALIAPVAMIVNEAWSTEGVNETVAAVATGTVFVLVLVRMQRLVSSQRAAAALHLRAERRETILRHAATALTAAGDREYIRLAALEGALALARDLPGTEVVVDLHGRPRHAGWKSDGTSRAVEVSLGTRASPNGQLVLTSSVAVPVDVVDALHTLGAQVALALEAVALTEDLSAQRSEARVGALVQNSTDMIMVVDSDFVIRYVTPSVAHALGHRPEQLVGTSATSLADPGDEELVRRFYAGVARNPGTSVTAEWRMRRSDGGFTEFEAVVCNLLENPSVEGIVVTAHDITDRKALEVGLKRQVQELEELDRIRSDFVATVSHELRTPLTNIIGEVELLEDGDRGELSSCQAHGVDVISRNSGRLRTLIEDLLTLGEVETRALVLHRQPLEVAGVIQEVGVQIAPTADAKSVTLEIDYGTEAGVILADPLQLDRALQNLLSNAVKFTPAGGRAALRVARLGDDVEFTVSDNGIGIPEAEQVRLFTRFFRSSEATRLAIQGTGLGLVIVKRIVEAHGGTVSIASTPDVGTTVTVRLPAGGTTDVEAGAA